MPRRGWAVLFGALFLLVSATPAFAADPWKELTRPPRMERSEAERQAARQAHGDEYSIMAAPGLNGKIVYTHAPYNAYPGSIWAIEPDGSSLPSQLHGGGTGEGDTLPAWSPGGTMIAFTRDTTSSTGDDAGDIYVMRADGGQLHRVTSTTAAEYSPAWSPDGSRIAFASNRAGNFEIYSMSIDGSDVRRLTTSSSDDRDPSWSPDGKKIAFLSDRAGNAEIYVMNADGGGVKRLTSNAAIDFTPTWSPDGSTLAFTSNRSGQLDIYTMNADGSSPTNVSNDAGSNDFNPAWSPDGSYIAYTGDPFGDFDILAVPAVGGAAGLITDSYDDDYNADWQPVPVFPLVDARFSQFDSDIQWVYNAGITSGCSAERYCPDDSVTRGQMAAFLARALDLPNATKDYFTDDETSIFEADINRLAEAGITTGCTSATTYCPTQTVTRGQMAAYLDRALKLPATSTDYFTDDETSIFEVDINRLAASGITSGCTATTYCPAQNVTRGQMAAFLHRAFG
jgi:Tol biopolymer transport system component